jgi:hypothetical protein
MLLYHGGNKVIDKIELRPHNRFLDFGEGFYTTPNLEQAKKFAGITVKHSGGKEIVNTYEYDEDKSNSLKKLVFQSANEEWLQFVVNNRLGKYNGLQYDIITGPVADDRVYETVKFFETGVYTFAEAMERLVKWKLYSQIVFCTHNSLELIKFKELHGG